MTTPSLTQSIRVMPLEYGGPFDRAGEQVAFGQRGEVGELDEGCVISSLVIDADDWRAMGEPGVVTVTIRPGDELNEGEGR